jgi:hypothetical protein
MHNWAFRLIAFGLISLLGWAITPAQAGPLIDARLTSFQSSDAIVNGVGPSGGIGTFQLLSSVTGTDVDFLGAEFMAQCLEPDEYVAVGDTYRFEVVDLAQAPTSTQGGMGALKAGWLESIMGGLGFGSVEDVFAADAVVRSAIQMATYEAVYEQSGTFSFTGGSTVLQGSGLAQTAAVQTALGGPVTLDGFALLNRGLLSAPDSRSLFRGQDFAVYNERSIPSPTPLALFGLGLLGMAGARKYRS